MGQDVQRQVVQQNLKDLEALSMGLVRRKKQDLQPDNFIFIGLGGTGINLLAKLKKEMFKEVKPEEITHKVRFLAVDTDAGEMDAFTGKKIFEENEVIRLDSNMNVRETINPRGPEYVSRTSKWVNKDLYGKTGKGEFGAKGAGQKRQVGRTHLMFDHNVTNIQDRLNAFREQLTVEKTEPKVYVYVMTGISGGTGAGTLIDFGIILKNTFVQSPDDRIAALLMLPSAVGGGSEANAYAVLKELDYVDTLEEDEGDRYIADYGIQTFQVNDKVFDNVTLLGGSATGIQFSKGTGYRVLTNFLLNQIVKNSYVYEQNGNRQFMYEQLLSNMIEESENIQQGQSKQLFPRNANYGYNAWGYTECDVPVELISAYVMRAVFKEFYTLYRKATGFNDLAYEEKENAVDDFLIDCGLTKTDIKKANGFSKDQIRKKVEDVFRVIVTDSQRGPFWAVQFTYFLVGSDDRYLQTMIENDKKGLFDNSYDARIETYKSLIEVIYDLNNQIFSVFTTVVEQIGYIVEKDGIKLNAKFEKDGNHTNFTWTPISFAKPTDVDKTSALLEFMQTNFLDHASLFSEMIWNEQR